MVRSKQIDFGYQAEARYLKNIGHLRDGMNLRESNRQEVEVGDKRMSKGKNRSHEKQLIDTIKEGGVGFAFLLSALVSVAAVILISIFIFANGFSAIGKIGVADFLLGEKWKPAMGLFGIYPMIIGSIYVTLGAVIIGAPIGIMTAVYLAEYCPKKIHPFFSGLINLMAGIPSVLYGFFGLVVIVPLIRENLNSQGMSLLAASILLGIMILPTIVAISQSSLKAVNPGYYEGSLALGATHERSIFAVKMKAASSGIISAVILGVGRAIGETMAVIMVAGNQAIIPKSVLEGVRTMTGNIVIEMGYATDLHRQALLATAAVLFVFILLVNLAFSIFLRRGSK